MKTFLLCIATLIALLSNPAIAQNVHLDDGLVALYPFIAGATDASGNGNNGTVIGATPAAGVHGRINSAYSFTGGAEISLPNAFKLPSITFCAWVFTTAVGFDRTIFTEYQDGNNCMKFYQNYSDNRIGIWLRAGAITPRWSLASPAGSAPLNQWNFVCFVLNSAADSARLYINGILSGQEKMNGYTPGGFGILAHTSIGHCYDVSTDHFAGTIDDVRAYNRALSGLEIAQLYQSSTTDGFMAYYSFSGNTNDQSGNGYNGAAAGGSFATDRFGIANSSYLFNGSNSRMTVAAFHPPVNNFSFSLWLNKPSFSTSSSAYEVVFSDAGFYQGTRLYFTRDSLYFEIQQGSTANGPPGRVRNVAIPVSAFSANAWYNVVGASSNGVLSIYLDGMLRQTRAGFLGDNGATAGFGIGFESNLNYGYFNGSIDDIRIYNHAGNNLQSGVIAYYPFSGHTNDQSGNGKNIVATSGSFTSDRFGNGNGAYLFNGSNSRMTVAAFHPPVNDFSFSVWLNKPSFSTSSSTYEVVFSDAGFYQGTRVYFTRDSLYFEIQQGSTANGPPGRVRNVAIPVAAFSGNAWYHVAGVSNNGVMSIYLNGALRQTRTAYMGDNGAAAAFGIGFESFLNSGFFNGVIDDIHFYNRPLTVAEISSLVITSVGDQKAPAVATEFNLDQNYPNPFNPSTTIRYSVPKTANVSLKIFNSLGQQIASLVNDRLEAGMHQVTWNASNVTSGVYFYRLQAGKFVETKKMIVLR